MPTSRGKIKSRKKLVALFKVLRSQSVSIVFTNGCFDLLHPGHVRYLQKARAEGDLLVVALNSDPSVRKIKGEGRPILPQSDRCEVIGALTCVDYVTTFDEETPQTIIEELEPNILVKGGDWVKNQIVGRDFVEKSGGKVVSIDFEKGFSTSDIIERIRGFCSNTSR